MARIEPGDEDEEHPPLPGTPATPMEPAVPAVTEPAAQPDDGTIMDMLNTEFDND